MIKSLLDYVKQVLCKGGEDAEGHVEVHPNSAKEGKGSGRLKTNIIWTFKLDMLPVKVDKPCVKLGGKRLVQVLTSSMCFSKNNLWQGHNIDDSVNNAAGSKDPEFE